MLEKRRGYPRPYDSPSPINCQVSQFCQQHSLTPHGQGLRDAPLTEHRRTTISVAIAKRIDEKRVRTALCRLHRIFRLRFRLPLHRRIGHINRPEQRIFAQRKALGHVPHIPAQGNGQTFAAIEEALRFRTFPVVVVRSGDFPPAAGYAPVHLCKGSSRRPFPESPAEYPRPVFPISA